MDRTDALQHAWFNGIGYVAWENVWGIWNGITPRDAEGLKRIQRILRFLGSAGLSSSDDWEPHTRDVVQAGAVFGSKFVESTRWGRHAPNTGSGCDQWTAWTLVERSGTAWPLDTPQLSIDEMAYAGCAFVDLYHGVPLSPARDSGSGRLVLRFPMEASGFGGVLATSTGAHDPSLDHLLTTQRELTRVPLETYDRTWRVARQHAVRNPRQPPPAHATAPAGAVLVPASGGAYHFVCSGVVIEPFEAAQRASFGIDVQFEWEDMPRMGEHRRPRAPRPMRCMAGPIR
jgi:hypothetical protein